MITGYRPRILSQLQQTIAPLKAERVLDFGSGDGYFASHISNLPGIRQVTPVDVVERKQSLLKPILYDGHRLPFEDRSFDLVYAIDVVHHCPDPLHALEDMMRCTSKYLLLKDHNYQTPIGRFALAVLDELGNRRFGIPSLYLYQRKWEWLAWIEKHGFKRIEFVHPMRCQTGLLAPTNGLQFMALWERVD